LDQKIIDGIKNRTDLWPWYWLACGEKNYCFQTVEAYPLDIKKPFPKPGTEIEFNEDGKWIGENGVEMIIESIIAEIEAQNGDAICEFIAAAHAHLLNSSLATDFED
jgi:hypothetical protein